MKSRWTARGLSTTFLALALLAFPRGAHAYSNHSLGFGYASTHVESDTNQTYRFHAPALQYSYFRASVVGFLMNLEIFFPISAVQDGRYHGTGRLYEKTLGADVALMLATQLRWGQALSLQVGAGPHLNAMSLTDRNLHNFQSLTAGVALMAALRWAVHRFINVGVNLLSAIDFGDLIHDYNGLRWGSHFSATASVGLHVD